MSMRKLSPPKAYRVATILWGRRFSDLFLSTTLPSLLASGNIPALVKDNKAEYWLLAEKEDFFYLKQQKLFNELSKLLPIKCVEIDNLPKGTKYKKLTQAHQKAMENLSPDDALFFFTPDAIWSNGTIQQILNIACQGYQCILMDGPRVVHKEFMREVSGDDFSTGEGVLSLAPREIVALTMKHIHPSEAACLWDSNFIQDVPFQLHWPVEGEGVVTRAFCLFPIMIRLLEPLPKFRGAIDLGLIDAIVNNSDNIYYCRDSDEMTVAGLDEMGFSSSSYKRTNHRDKILRIAKWAYREALPKNLEALLQPTRRHYTSINEASWQRVEKLSDYHCRSILKCHELLVLHDILLKKGLDLAAGILAFSLNEGSILGWLRDDRPVTYLVPTNEALADKVPDLYASNAKAERDKKIRILLGRHVLSSRHSSDDLNGVYQDSKIIQGNIEVGDGLIHIIDKCL